MTRNLFSPNLGIFLDQNGIWANVTRRCMVDTWGHSRSSLLIPSHLRMYYNQFFTNALNSFLDKPRPGKLHPPAGLPPLCIRPSNFTGLALDSQPHALDTSDTVWKCVTFPARVPT